MRRPIPLFLLLLVGCTSANAGTPALQETAGRQIRVSGVNVGRLDLEIGHRDRIVTRTFAARVDEVWTRLPAAFEALELEVNMGDRRARVLGVQNARLRSIAGSRPSEYLECGVGVAGANADRYQVFLTLLAQVQPGENGASTVSIQVDATARDIASSGNPVICGSNGRLEAELLDMIEQLGE